MRVLMVVLWVMLSVAAARAGEIHDAVAAGDAARVSALLRAQPELVRAPNENQTRDLPLHTAAIGGQLEVARLLLDAGAAIDGFDADESTPLHVAALNRHPELVDLLIARGADVNRRDRNGAYALSFAISGRDSVVVRHVLDAGADLNFVSSTGTQLMHMAVSRGLWDIVDRLLARGDDINVVDRQHLLAMKDGAIVCNSGHFDAEINKAALDRLAKSRRELRQSCIEYTLKSGRRVILLAEGRLVNLAAAEGHPAMVMDMSFANQAVAAEYILKNKGKLENRVYKVPEDLDKRIAEVKLHTLGIKIDKLTAEQAAYISSWQHGT